MSTIEISDQREGALSFDMIDLLAVIEPFASGLDWYFVDFYVGSFHTMADTEHVEPWVLALWHAVEESKEPTRVSWATLKDFARHVRQTDMCLLIGVRPNSKPPSEPLDPNSEGFEIVVQAFDFTFWAVTSRNRSLEERLLGHFKNTVTVANTRRYY